MPLEPYHLGPSPTEDTVIWKYFPRWQFESLVNDGALFFRRVFDYLTEDPNEGTIPKRDQARDRMIALYRHMRNPKSTLDDLKVEVNIAESVDGFGMRHTTVINCWTMRATESRLMWIGYAGVKDGAVGVAVRSTVKMLKKSLREQPRVVNMATVRYIDYDNEQFADGTGNVMTPMLHKNRHGYEDEAELRLLHSYQGIASFRAEEIWDEYPGCRATKIDLNLSDLLCEVVLSPNATDADLEQVKDLCAGKGVSPGVTKFRHSNLHPMGFAKAK